MVQFIKRGPSRRDLMQEQMGQQLGKSLSSFANSYYANKALDNVLEDESLKDAPQSERTSRIQRALQGYGEEGMTVLQGRMQAEQQRQQEEQQGLFSKLLSGKELSDKEISKLPAQFQLEAAKLRRPKEPAGGITGQAPPAEISQKIPKILNANKESTADELQVAMDESGIPRIFSNSYVENRRRQDETKSKEATEEKKSTRKEELEFHKESSKYDEEILESSKRAKKQELAIKDISDALASGKVKPGSISNLFKGMGSIGEKISNAFLSAEQGKFAASIPQLLEGWKEVFGVRLTDADLKILEDKLPSISKNKEANEAVLEVIQKYSKPAILREEISREIKDKNKGLRPLGYADQVEKELQKRLEKDQYKDIKVPPGEIKVKFNGIAGTMSKEKYEKAFKEGKKVELL